MTHVDFSYVCCSVFPDAAGVGLEVLHGDFIDSPAVRTGHVNVSTRPQGRGNAIQHLQASISTLLVALSMFTLASVFTPVDR